ncbi:hypothetical protein CEP53_009895 [Fusarium sp. AF-6]|nr:hypothetical protein CEP53_009895 [Fusarium sp. AF-6]
MGYVQSRGPTAKLCLLDIIQYAGSIKTCHSTLSCLFSRQAICLLCLRLEPSRFAGIAFSAAHTYPVDYTTTNHRTTPSRWLPQQQLAAIMQHPSLALLTRLSTQPAIVSCGLLYSAVRRMSLSAENTGLDFSRPPQSRQTCSIDHRHFTRDRTALDVTDVSSASELLYVTKWDFCTSQSTIDKETLDQTQPRLMNQPIAPTP